MEYLYVGKIVNTHGIKGELRIRSNFDRKDLAFKPGVKLYFGDGKEEHKIVTYRPHKEFDMVTFKNYSNINEVLKYLKQDVYIKKEDLDLSANEYVLEELVGCHVYENDTDYGIVSEIVYNNSNVLLSISGAKNFYIPNNPNFIKNVDIDNKKIIVENIKGLML